VAHGHPWVYRDALHPHRCSPGEVVRVVDRRGRFLAGGLAEAGPIAVRVFTRSAGRILDASLLRERVEAALQLRARLMPPETDGYRLIHGEGDALPGLVVDRYASSAVVKFDGEAISVWREPLLEILNSALPRLGVDRILLRGGRGHEKRAEAVLGDLPREPVAFREHGMTLLANLVDGQKTGMFLDHRIGRHRVSQLAQGLRVLNLFGYTGAFSIAAGRGGATRVVTVDSAPAAIELAGEGWAANGLDPATHEGCVEKVEDFMSRSKQADFDLVIADPPSFAPRESAKRNALKAYRALHRSCLRTVALGGYYLAASCSSHVDREAFETTLREAAHGEKRALQVIARWGAGEDHPVPLGFPEGNYLKSTLVRVVAR
jgi:23S rRNA (cytosine1962-C5)-methyltransferase